MTRQEALRRLAKLDAYWSEPRNVNQYVGKIYNSIKNPCGCFGAHCAVALGKGRKVYIPFGEARVFRYGDGELKLKAIAEALNTPRAALADLLYKYSASRDSFDSQAWLTHPNEAWPLISKELRELAG